MTSKNINMLVTLPIHSSHCLRLQGFFCVPSLEPIKLYKYSLLTHILVYDYVVTQSLKFRKYGLIGPCPLQRRLPCPKVSWHTGAELQTTMHLAHPRVIEIWEILDPQQPIHGASASPQPFAVHGYVWVQRFVFPTVGCASSIPLRRILDTHSGGGGRRTTSSTAAAHMIFIERGIFLQWSEEKITNNFMAIRRRRPNKKQWHIVLQLLWVYIIF